MVSLADWLCRMTVDKCVKRIGIGQMFIQLAFLEENLFALALRGLEMI